MRAGPGAARPGDAPRAAGHGGGPRARRRPGALAQAAYALVADEHAVGVHPAEDGLHLDHLGAVGSGGGAAGLAEALIAFAGEQGGVVLQLGPPHQHHASLGAAVAQPCQQLLEQGLVVVDAHDGVAIDQRRAQPELHPPHQRARAGELHAPVVAPASRLPRHHPVQAAVDVVADQGRLGLQGQRVVYDEVEGLHHAGPWQAQVGDVPAAGAVQHGGEGLEKLTWWPKTRLSPIHQPRPRRRGDPGPVPIALGVVLGDRERAHPHPQPIAQDVAAPDACFPPRRQRRDAERDLEVCLQQAPAACGPLAARPRAARAGAAGSQGCRGERGRVIGSA